MPSVTSLRPVKVLIIGGSYGGLAAALNLLDLCVGRPARFSTEKEKADFKPRPRIGTPFEIKIVDERDGYYHVIGSPLALASKSFAAKAWTRFSDLPALREPGITWTHGSCEKVDCENKIAIIKDIKTGKKSEESYDYLISSSGLRREWPVVPQALSKEDYQSEVDNHIQTVKDAREGVVVIGGGAVGIEMAAELKLVQPDLKVILIHSRPELLSSEPLPSDFKEQTLVTLRESGVEVILNDRVTDVTPIDSFDEKLLYRLTLKDGSHLTSSKVIWAISRSVPTSTYLPESALDSEGYVKIEPSLHFVAGTPNARDHLALGDVVAWSGIKRCGGAMHMGHFAAMNVYQQILADTTGSVTKFSEIQEYKPVIALAVGKKAVGYWEEAGTTVGEDLMKTMFGDDLGFSICWNYLDLGTNPSAVAEV